MLANNSFNGHLIINDNNPKLRKKVVLVEQQHHFKNLSNTSNFYYQQRFNSQDSEDAITVEEDLQNILSKNIAAKDELIWLADLFDIKKLYTERLIQLSNGENKRLQIVKALLLQPAFLLLDNPFTGLDVKSRQILGRCFRQSCQKRYSYNNGNLCCSHTIFYN
ncbi:MAG: ATP-binding cassette domain-containing protein [Segetibacter sp.]